MSANKSDEELRTALYEAAWAASHSADTYLSAQYRRFVRRLGQKGNGKAVFAVAPYPYQHAHALTPLSRASSQIGRQCVEHRVAR